MKRLMMLGALALGMMTVSCTDRDRGDTPFIAANLVCQAVDCLSDGDCADPNPYCRADGTCGVCNANEHCTDPGMGACRAEGCVCSSDQGCIDSGEGVSCADGLCVACDVDADCTVAGSETCFDGGSTDSFCGCDGTMTGTVATGCVGQGSQLCGDDGNCIACAADADCTEAGLGQCYGGGDVGAFCGCASDADCGDDTCIDGECVAVECDTAADCGDLPVCVGGGTADAVCQCNDDSQCGAGGLCSIGEDAESGDCETPECVSDSDCTAPTGKCWYAGQTFAYCGCMADGDCTTMGDGNRCTEPDGVCACSDIDGNPNVGSCSADAPAMAACR